MRAINNIEDWLVELLKKMQLTMKDIARACANDLQQLTTDINGNVVVFIVLLRLIN